MDLGWFLSIVDRVSGYALGDFSKALEMAKKNAHALTWHPSLITKRSVSYFEDLLNNESRMCQNVLRSLPNEMRKNFMNSVLSFMRMREREIKIESECVFDRLKLVPFKDPIQIRSDNYFISKIFSIYDEMPKPLQLTRIGFTDSIKNDETILVTLRKNDKEGEIVGFAKGGPLENYTLRKEISDENFGQKNTIFLEPVALKMGYWGFNGDVIRERVSKESAEFVRLFDPEHWDYYRVNLLKKFKN
jgi:hypothetical protein